MYALILMVALGADGRPDSAPADAPWSASEVVEAFVRHVVQSSAAPDSQRRFVLEQAEQRRGGRAEAALVHEALALLNEDFRAGLDALSSDDLSRAADRFGRCAASDDPFLAAAATFFAAQVLTNQDRLLEADRLLVDLGQRWPHWPRYTTAAAELSFLRGFCALHALRYDEAAAALERFLRRYPAAPERMRRSAEQMLKELAEREPDGLGDVQDLMRFARREIAHGRTDEDLRIRQEEAVALLDALIQEAEQREQSQSGASAAGESGRRGGTPGPRPGQSPAQRSDLPSGGTPPEGELRAARRARPGDAWGAMPPRQREALLQSLQNQFPGQYRDLIEQYYRQLSKEETPP